MVEEEEKQAPTELARKQKFENLTKVLDENHYDIMPSQGNCSVLYQDTTKTVKIEWTAVLDEDLHQRNNKNILKNKPCLRGARKYVETPLKAFNLLFTEDSRLHQRSNRASTRSIR